MDLKKHQPSLNIDEQIENLRSKGLLFDDENQAKQMLNDVSYFRLIKGYSLGLKPINENYFEGVSFNDIIELYKFDSHLRQFIFPRIETVEVNLRCRIGNYFSNKYDIFGYEDSDNFKDPEYHSELVKSIKLEISRNKKSPYVRNFTTAYNPGKLPFYSLIELFSFGTLSKFYKNMLNADKKCIADYYNVKYTYLESWIESIAYVRNICAHYGRLYNIKLTKTPAIYDCYRNMGIRNNRIFAILICLKYLLPMDERWRKFISNINLSLKYYQKVDLKKIGFPDNWIEILLPDNNENKQISDE